MIGINSKEHGLIKEGMILNRMIIKFTLLGIVMILSNLKFQLEEVQFQSGLNVIEVSLNEMCLMKPGGLTCFLFSGSNLIKSNERI